MLPKKQHKQFFSIPQEEHLFDYEQKNMFLTLIWHFFNLNINSFHFIPTSNAYLSEVSITKCSQMKKATSITRRKLNRAYG